MDEHIKEEPGFPDDETYGDETYGFGPREGKLVEELYRGFCNFAHDQDISLPELLGLIDITCGFLKSTMISAKADRPADFSDEELFDDGFADEEFGGEQ